MHSEITRLDGEREKLKRVRGHVDLDSRHVVEAESRLLSVTSSKTTEFDAKRKQLISDQDELRSRMQALERQLTDLRAQEKILIDGISDQDARIAQAQAELAEESESVKGERAALEIRRATMLLDEEALQAVLQAHSFVLTHPKCSVLTHLGYSVPPIAGTEYLIQVRCTHAPSILYLMVLRSYTSPPRAYP